MHELTPMEASMTAVTTRQVQVAGEKSGSRATKILDPVFICKGKLQAAATRAKHSDAADLLFLEGKHNAELQARKEVFNRRHVGMAMKRYTHLTHSFETLGLDLKACKGTAESVDLSQLLARPEPDSVQNASLFNMRAA